MRLPLLPFDSSKSEEFHHFVTTDFPVTMVKALHYVEEHVADNICLAAFAREAGVSKYHFCRVFKQYAGMTPMSFVVRMRIQRSKELLRRDNVTVSMVAAEAGFKECGSFCRQFKKLKGITPSSYRASFTKKSAA